MSVRRLTAVRSGTGAPGSAAPARPRPSAYFREGSFPARYAPHDMPDSSFIFCRLAYRSVRMEQSGIGWQTDYPYAEINLMTRLSELTQTRVSRDVNQEPNHFVVRPTDDALFNCPFVMASDAGHRRLHRCGGRAAAALSAQGRVPVGGRLLGHAGLDAVVQRDRARAATVRVSD